MFEAAKTVENGKATFTLKGRLDATAAPELEREVKSSLDGVKTLVFDFMELDYISSAGLRVLLYAQKVMNHQGEMTIRNANAAVKEIFEITGFLEILTVE